jgi:hypothetical protein
MVSYFYNGKDWWQIYAKRRENRSFEYEGTGFIRQYSIDHSKQADSIGPITTYGRPTYRALLCDEIYLRVAHYSHPLFDNSVQRLCCIACRVLLPTSALFLAGYYYCVTCIEKNLLPSFCGERLWLVREAGFMPDDLILLVVKYVAYLSFSHRDIEQILEGHHCDCALYDCQSKEEKRILCDYLAQYLKLQKKLS